MPASFKDYFSAGSDNYARFRPTYPAALFAFLAECAPARRAAWDCATGNGQAAVALAPHFETVIATDASAQQLTAATPATNVEYRIATAETSGLGSSSVDLITVAQAFHWFDADAFFAEAERVLGRDGVLALWCYEICSVSPDCDRCIDRLYRDITGPYWTAERDLVEAGYRSFVLPGAELDAPAFAMQADWSVDAMLGYLRTWSAGRRYAEVHGEDPVTLVEDELRSAWGDGERCVKWPLSVRLCRLNTVD